jgi:hypothetical protein
VVFSQPYADGSPSAAPDGEGPVDTLISMAASLALRDGNPDSVRAQLPPQHHAAFDMALAVQEMRGDSAEGEEKKRLSLRTQDEIEKRRASRKAADELAAEEKAALYAAADADGDTFTLLSSAELDELPEAEPLVEGFLVKESLIRLYGPPKSFKSFVMLDLAACIGGGIDWHGKKVVQSKVLYVVAEGVRGIKRRVRAWEAVNKRAMTGVHFYERAVQLGDRNDVSTLIRTAKRGGYEFIILDTQARCTVGLEENSASEMGVVVAALDVLKEVTGACVALVHHSGASGGRARGSTAILGALDAEFEVEADKDSMSVSVHTRAQKDLAEAPSVDFDLVTPAEGGSLAVRARRAWYQPRPEDLAPLEPRELETLRVVDTLAGVGGTASDIAKHLGEDMHEVKVVLSSLHRKGAIRSKGSAFFTDKLGRLHLSGTLDAVRED